MKCNCFKFQLTHDRFFLVYLYIVFLKRVDNNKYQKVLKGAFWREVYFL